jgi:dolichol-phosphate mannosyltransferase
MRYFRERHRFLRGMFASLGFQQTVIEYPRSERFAGQTKYPFFKMLHFAIDAVLSFSAAPIKFIVWLSMAMWLASLVYLAWSLYEHFVLGSTITGWTSIIFLLTLFTGLVLFTIGIVATYIGRMFEELKDRPLYWIQDCRNIDLESMILGHPPPREKVLSAQLVQRVKGPED